MKTLVEHYYIERVKALSREEVKSELMKRIEKLAETWGWKYKCNLNESGEICFY